MDELLAKFKVKDIFVGGLSPSSDLQLIINHFQEIMKTNVEIEFPRVKLRKSGNKSPGYFVIKNLTEQQVRTLLVNRDPEIGGVIFHLKPYFTGSQLKAYKKYIRQKRLYVKGVPHDWGTKELRNFLSEFGKLEEACAIVDLNTRKCRGYGFGIFENASDAKRCMDMQRLVVNGVELWSTNYEDRFIFEEADESSINVNKNNKDIEVMSDSLNKDLLPQNPGAKNLDNSKNETKINENLLQSENFREILLHDPILKRFFQDSKVRYNFSRSRKAKRWLIAVGGLLYSLESNF